MNKLFSNKTILFFLGGSIIVILWRLFGVNTEQILWETQLFQPILNPPLWMYGIVPFVVVVYIAVWYMIWLKKGKEYISIPKPTSIATAFPPMQRSPALVEYLVNQGIITQHSFTATILWLTKKKMLRLETDNIKNTAIIYFQPEKCIEEIDHIDRLVFNSLLQMSSNNTNITYEEAKAYMKLHPEEMRLFFTNWQQTVKRKADELGFLEVEGTHTQSKFYITTTILVVAISVFLNMIGLTGKRGYVETDSLMIGGFILIYIIGRTFLRWDRKYGEEVLRWIAFKKYISEVSRISDEGHDALVIWNDILIYATALGCAKEMTTQLPFILLQDPDSPNISFIQAIV